MKIIRSLFVLAILLVPVLAFSQTWDYNTLVYYWNQANYELKSGDND